MPSTSVGFMDVNLPLVSVVRLLGVERAHLARAGVARGRGRGDLVVHGGEGVRRDVDLGLPVDHAGELFRGGDKALFWSAPETFETAEHTDRRHRSTLPRQSCYTMAQQPADPEIQAQMEAFKKADAEKQKLMVSRQQFLGQLHENQPVHRKSRCRR